MSDQFAFLLNKRISFVNGGKWFHFYFKYNFGPLYGKTVKNIKSGSLCLGDI